MSVTLEPVRITGAICPNGSFKIRTHKGQDTQELILSADDALAIADGIKRHIRRRGGEIEVSFIGFAGRPAA